MHEAEIAREKENPEADTHGASYRVQRMFGMIPFVFATGACTLALVRTFAPSIPVGLLMSIAVLGTILLAHKNPIGTFASIVLFLAAAGIGWVAMNAWSIGLAVSLLFTAVILFFGWLFVGYLAGTASDRS